MVLALGDHPLLLLGLVLLGLFFVLLFLRVMIDLIVAKANGLCTTELNPAT